MAIKDALLGELKQEGSNTRKMLQQVPAASFSWKPHEKSHTLLQLAQHVANLPVWTRYIMLQDEYDFSKPLQKPEPAKDTQALLDLFDQRMAEAAEILNGITDEEMNKTWTFRTGTHVHFTVPRKIIFRSFVISHGIHHRGQLSVYLRLLDIPVPGMYGPSADEKG